VKSQSASRSEFPVWFSLLLWPNWFYNRCSRSSSTQFWHWVTCCFPRDY
jgi:hypothetical protein